MTLSIWYQKPFFKQVRTLMKYTHFNVSKIELILPACATCFDILFTLFILFF